MTYVALNLKNFFSMYRFLKNRNCYELFASLLLALFLLVSPNAKSQNPTAPALNFNVFLQKGATLINNETEGPVAMGGDLTLSQNSYQVSTNYTGTFTVNGVKVTLLIGGHVNFNGGNGLTVDQNGYVKIGDCGSSKTWYTDQNNAYSPIRITPGQDYNGSPRINLQANSQQLGVSASNNPVCQGGLIDFDAAFTTMKATSSSISACTDNCNLTNSNGNPIPHTGLPNQVKINLNAGINTLNLLGSDMNNVQDFIYNNHPDASHILVINVNAPGTFNWSVYNSGGIGFGECPYILYNFYNTTTLNIQGNGAVEGTVFAPYADIVKTSNQANIEGQIIAQSYIHNGGENHYPPFNANIPGCGTNSCSIKVSGTKNDITCHDSNNGSIDITVSGNNGTVTYLWNDGATTEDRTNLPSGSYSVTATDAAKCSVSSSGFTISNSSAISVSGSVINVTTVGGSNGSITLTVSGGTGSYTYLWNDGVTSKDRTGLSAGSYSVTVTDEKGCTKTTNFIVGSPNCTISVSGVKHDITCHDSNNGSIDITVSGNNGTVTYLWNDGVTTEDRTNLPSGSYSVTATDAAKCSVSSSSFTISNPSAISVSGSVINVTTVGGSNGSISLTVSGGTGSYTYLWNDGVTSKDRTGLSAGSYSVTVTDEKGCTKTTNFIVGSPNCTISVSGVKHDITCHDSNNGSIDITVSGNNGTVTYLWNDGATTEDRTNLPSGSYSVTATDAAKCSVSSSGFTISNPSAISVSGSVINVTTVGGSNGSITLTVSGGTGSYTYLWNDGVTSKDRTGLSAGSYSVTVTDEKGCTKTTNFIVGSPNCTISVSGVKHDITCHDSNNGSIDITVSGNNGTVTYLWNDGVTTEDRTNLIAGSYSVTATDAAKCSVSSSSFTISNPSAISVSGSVINVTTVGGSNGSISLTVSGGTGSYTYLWNDGVTSKDRTGLSAGSYSVTVTDENGCTSITTYIVTQPNCTIAVKAVVTNVKCNGGNTGAINVTVTGNKGVVTYLWNDGITTEDRTNLIAGSYSVTATDAGGCKVTSPVYVIKQATKILIKSSVTPQTTKTSCDGTATINVTGGTAPYTITWNDGYVGASRTGLCMGTYTVTVTDKNGCSAMCTVKILCKAVSVQSVSGSDQSSLSTATGSFTVTVSPNPTKGLIRLSLNAETSSVATITVFDLSGRAVVTNKINVSKGSNYNEMDLSSLARGAYMVQIVSDNNKKTVKIILD